jgi:hypothetical protein
MPAELTYIIVLSYVFVVTVGTHLESGPRVEIDSSSPDIPSSALLSSLLLFNVCKDQRTRGTLNVIEKELLSNGDVAVELGDQRLKRSPQSTDDRAPAESHPNRNSPGSG